MFTMVDLCGTKQTLSFSKQNALTFSNSYWMQHLLWFSTNLLLQQEQIFKKKKKTSKCKLFREMFPQTQNINTR